jgi:hypothetical protein
MPGEAHGEKPGERRGAVPSHSPSPWRQVAQADTPVVSAPSPVPPATSSATPLPSPTPSPSASPAPASPSPFSGLPAGLDTHPEATVAQTLLDLPVVRDLPFRGLLFTGIELALLLALYLGLRRLTQRLIARTTEAVARREEAAGYGGRAIRLRTLSGLTTGVLLWTLGFLFLVSGLRTVGADVTGILASASVVGLAVGFGAQKLTKDLITGFFLLLEDQYAVGDYVTLGVGAADGSAGGTVTGVVEELGMRITRLRDDEGRLNIVSNGDISRVCNHSRGPVAGSFEIGIVASADPGKAAQVLTGALKVAGERLGLPEAPAVEGVTAADATRTVLRISYRAPASQRPSALAPPLREVSRAALIEAKIPLG